MKNCFSAKILVAFSIEFQIDTDSLTTSATSKEVNKHNLQNTVKALMCYSLPVALTSLKVLFETNSFHEIN